MSLLILIVPPFPWCGACHLTLTVALRDSIHVCVVHQDLRKSYVREGLKRQAHYLILVHKAEGGISTLLRSSLRTRCQVVLGRTPPHHHHPALCGMGDAGTAAVGVFGPFQSSKKCRVHRNRNVVLVHLRLGRSWAASHSSI